MNYRAFMKEFFSNPIMTGSLIPSSAALVTELLKNLRPANVQSLVEVGPGSGAVTQHLYARLTAKHSYLGVDINPVFIQALRPKFPEFHFETASAENLSSLLDAKNIRSCDLIISSLPWSLIQVALQEKIIQNIFDSLSTAGEFVTFSYLHTPLLSRGRQFQLLLKNYFPSVQQSKIVWANFPPAVVYHCRKS